MKRTTLLLTTGCLALGILAGVVGAIDAEAQTERGLSGTGTAIPAEKPPEHHEDFERGYYELDYYEQHNR